MITPITAAPLLAHDALRDHLDAGLRRARRRGAPVLVSVSVPLPALDPLDLFVQAGVLAHDRLYWERPADGVAMAGIGVARAIEAAGAAEAGYAWRALLERALVDSVHGGEMAGPLLMGGFAFASPQAQSNESTRGTPWEGFPAGRLTLPRLSLATAGGASVLTVNSVLSATTDVEAARARLLRWCETVLSQTATARGPRLRGGQTTGPAVPRPATAVAWQTTGTAVPGRRAGMHYVCRRRAEPDRSRRSLPSRQAGSPRSRRHDEDVQVDDLLPRWEWEALVEDAARACRTGALEKVVLARAVRARAQAPFDPAVALERLRDAYPNAYVFAVARGPRCFLGATPERLVRLRDGAVDAACLAGSAPRGETPEEDARLGTALLASVKDRAEHAVVVRSVRAALEGVCSDVHSPDVPRLLRLRNVQHLYTPVDGQVSWPTCVLDLVQRLHPTPAVGGYPREGALRFIRAREGLDRGWYAGPVGWLDRRGDGEFAVALRSALLHGAEATLFAGSGIVAQSRASDEYAETCLKLHPMLNALGTEAVGGRR
jgi:isochorismate synthase